MCQQLWVCISKFLPITFSMELTVVSVLGADRVGIVAGIASVLARHNVNIIDISRW